MIRYVRAFFIALRMTLRGQTPPARYPQLTTWIQLADALLNTVYQTAEKNGVTIEQCKTIMLRIDSRDVSMETILAAVHYNLTQVYPRHLALRDAHNLTVIYASNLNDAYRVLRLASAPELENTAIKPSIQALLAHLEAIPQQN